MWVSTETKKKKKKKKKGFFFSNFRTYDFEIAAEKLPSASFSATPASLAQLPASSRTKLHKHATRQHKDRLE
jgi:hypothetical protein